MRPNSRAAGRRINAPTLFVAPLTRRALALASSSPTHRDRQAPSPERMPWKTSQIQQAAGFLRGFTERGELAGDSELELCNRIQWLTHICMLTHPINSPPRETRAAWESRCSAPRGEKLPGILRSRGSCALLDLD